MQDYDATLKLLFRKSARKVIQLLTGGTIEKWLDIELPKVQDLRMDLLGEDPDGELDHFDLQSRNEANEYAEREYAMGTIRLTGKIPRQVDLVLAAQGPSNTCRSIFIGLGDRSTVHPNLGIK